MAIHLAFGQGAHYGLAVSPRPVALALVAALALCSTATLPAHAAKKPALGKPCKKLGASYTVKPGIVLVCALNAKGKPVWSKSGAGGGGGGSGGPTPSSGVPAVIESWGVSVAPYDAATMKAGDLYVGAIPFPTGSVNQAVIQYYGEGPRRPQDPPDFIDPQMTFYVPIHTKVRAIATGEVCWVKALNTGYSDDYSIGLGVSVDGRPACQTDPGSGQGSGTVATWEHEHVMEPAVKVGDKVTAGQVIAEASYYTKDNWLYTSGYALYEIGILVSVNSGGPPQHVCPALYLAPKARDALLAQLATAARAFEANTGTSHYEPKTLETGCITEKVSAG